MVLVPFQVDQNLSSLQGEVENFILRMAAEFPSRKEQLLFLINNYDMMLSVLAVSVCVCVWMWMWMWMCLCFCVCAEWEITVRHQTFSDLLSDQRTIWSAIMFE